MASNGNGNRRFPLRAVLLVAFLAVAGWILYTTSLDELLDVPMLLAETRLIAGRWWAPLLFFVLYAILNIFFIPPQALSIAAVVAWGWVLGGAIELVVATVTALFPYWIARSAAGPWVEGRMARHKRIMELLAREGFSVLLLIRLVPLIPYTAVNYAAGFTVIRTWPYLIATFFGMIPAVFIFAYFVDALVEGLMRPMDVLLRIIGAGLALGAFALSTRAIAHRLKRRIDHSTDKS